MQLTKEFLILIVVGLVSFAGIAIADLKLDGNVRLSQYIPGMENGWFLSSPPWGGRYLICTGGLGCDADVPTRSLGFTIDYVVSAELDFVADVSPWTTADCKYTIKPVDGATIITGSVTPWAVCGPASQVVPLGQKAQLFVKLQKNN